MLETKDNKHSFSEEGVAGPSFFPTQKELAGLTMPLATRAAKRLMPKVLSDEQNQAEREIIKCPESLFVKLEVQDKSGKITFARPFQAALAFGNKAMWQMMLNHLELDEALKQFVEWFPVNIKSAQNTALPVDYNAIAQAIIKDDDHGLAVVYTFREELNHPRYQKIPQEHYFNLQHLIAAYQAYINNYDAFSSEEMRDLFWQKVIGWVQAKMTSSYDNQKHFATQIEVDNQNFLGTGFSSACFSYCNSSTGAVQSADKQMAEKSLKALKRYEQQRLENLEELEDYLIKKCETKPNACACC